MVSIKVKYDVDDAMMEKDEGNNSLAPQTHKGDDDLENKVNWGEIKGLKVRCSHRAWENANMKENKFICLGFWRVYW